MKKLVLTYGLISGTVLAITFAVTLSLSMNGTIDFDNNMVIGYTAMVLAFLAVFFGVRTYRERNGAGSITFGRAFKVGILITLITCAVYVISWEIVYFNFLPDFVDRYTEHVLGKMAREGADAAALAAEQKKMAEFKVLYANPFFNVGMTFLEVFPVGLIVTLVSAAILRRKPDGDTPTAAPASA